MIKAIIFDCFGVLTTDGWLPFKKKHFGHDPALEAQATGLNKQVDAGLADYDDFVGGVAELAAVSKTEARSAIEENVAQEELFEYIKNSLKVRYKIGMLSNVGANWLPDLFSPEQVKLFDAVALSYETGFVKPDERAYQTIAKRLDVAPGECVLLDDRERYCLAAEAADMKAIVYKDFIQAKRELENMLTDPEN